MILALVIILTVLLLHTVAFTSNGDRDAPGMLVLIFWLLAIHAAIA